ncbi:sugar phosphate isomerase/epimerase family protein [Paenibacillus spongiae]|uniref:Sugar phosphate isomerase/epimerase n=1 Tax=Paenibacillus spongiae TaxID=2909671 RepID=A0ABY5S455_9BACL|nr:sugar phosphate isomerase/epimerase family protein [Paenibacillus spongiae]UVI27625.1 sugar phosphate isomerase/epimerase [Paenibacillus spongiae]
MPYLSLTTWSLHRHLGPLHWTRWDAVSRTHTVEIQQQPETVPLLDLPGILAEKGFSAVELCHFNLPETSAEYLGKLRQAIQAAGIRLYTLLLDYGDIASPDPARRTADIAFMKQWIDYAAAAGAERIRIIAGDSDPSDQAGFDRAAAALHELIDYASPRGVRVVTENFHSLTSTADNCVALLDNCGDHLGFTSDFGNFKGADKYESLIRTVPRSESIHAKAMTDAEGMPDGTEFVRCLEIVKDAGYEGPITLVYDGPGDMWEGIQRVRALAAPYLT